MTDGNVPMRDTLDLEQLDLEAKRYRRRNRIQILISLFTTLFLIVSIVLTTSQTFVYQYVFSFLPKSDRPGAILSLDVFVMILSIWVVFYVSISSRRIKAERLTSAHLVLQRVISDLSPPRQSFFRLRWKMLPVVVLLFVGPTILLITAAPTLDYKAALSLGRFLDSLVTSFPVIAVSLVVMLVFVYLAWFYSTRMMLPRRLVYGASVQQGNYDDALRQIERWRRVWPKHLYHLYMGLALTSAGRLQESESALIESIKAALKSNPKFLETVLNQLGYMMLAQERYARALQYFEAAVQIRPESSNTYASLADVYLYQGTQPARALELIERAISYRTRRDAIHVAIWATRGWALALLGRRTEATDSLKMSLNKSGRKNESAELYYIAGQVNRLVGDHAEANEFFKRALNLEPTGIHSELAERALRNMGYQES